MLVAEVPLKGETGRPLSVFITDVEYDPSIICAARFFAFVRLVLRLEFSVVREDGAF